MRIAAIGNFQPPYSTENDYRRAWEILGHECIPLQESVISASEIHRQALTSDMLTFTSTWDDAVDPVQFSETVEACKSRGIPTVAIHLDVFHGTERGGRNWRINPMWLCEYVMTADGDHPDEWTEMGVNHHWLPPAIRDDAVGFAEPLIDYRCDVAFVGASGVLDSYHPEVWPYRAELVGELRRMCARRRWTFLNPGGEPDQPNWGKIDRGPELGRFYSTAKVTVGDSLCLKREASHYWSDRVYEATGRGGLLIMPDIEALQDDDQFAGHLPVYSWGDFDELEYSIEYLLDDNAQRLAVRKNCQAITADRHKYSDRARTILETVGLT